MSVAPGYASPPTERRGSSPRRTRPEDGGRGPSAWSGASGSSPTSHAHPHRCAWPPAATTGWTASTRPPIPPAARRRGHSARRISARSSRGCRARRCRCASPWTRAETSSRRPIPAGGAGTWSFGTIDPDGSDLTGVSCPSARLCVAVDLDGAIFASTNPAGGPATWYLTRRRGGRKRGWFDVSCPNVRLCVAAWQRLRSVDGSGAPRKLAPHRRTCERRSDQGHNRDLMRLAASVRGRRPVRAGVRVDRPARWRPRVARDPGAPTHAGGRECEGRVLALARAGMCRRGDRQRMAGRRTCPSGSPPRGR